MKVFRQKTLKPVSLVLAIFMLLISGPFQAVYAAMIGTETVLASARGQEARAFLKQLLAREDIQKALVAQGIDAGEAKARVDSLSDAEAVKAADKFDQLPAASGFFETLLIVAFLVFLILLITDIAGYTDIFPFVKPMR
ncbi:MAG: PA2779 family protein [Deltaproteobacteria bacterium]|jgi:ribosomal protein L4|nr:PA2779 family protein [Deltaproteobacteria bacterium]